MLKRITSALLIAAALVVGVYRLPAVAQVPSVPGPYNIDIGAVLKLTLSPAGTYNSPTGSAYATTPINLVYNGIVCTLTGSVVSGSPSVNWSIQQYDAASNSYFTLLTQSVAYSALIGQNVIEVRPSVQTLSLPTNMASINLALPRVWRIQAVVGGSLGPALTAQVGCNFVK